VIKKKRIDKNSLKKLEALEEDSNSDNEDDDDEDSDDEEKCNFRISS
jgi:hypothetical protein